MVVSVRSLLFDKGEYIMKLSQKKWKSLISGVLLAASASSFLIAPVYAADYSKPLIGTFKKDSEILSPDGNTVQENDGKLIYDFQGKDHTFTITNKDGITARKDSVYNNVDADGKYGTLHIYQTNDKSNAWAGVNGFTANKGTVIVNSNLDITAASEYSSVGIAAANKGNLIINGNVKMRKDNTEKPWGIITKNVHGNVGPGGGAASMGGDENYTGARWQPAGISVDYSRGDITINGDVDIAVRGTAVRTDVYQADGDVPAYDLGTISLLGNSIRIDTPYREENFVEGFGKFIEPYYALASYGGTINVNVKNQEAQNGKVEMVGNVLAMKSSDEAGKAMVYQNGRLNIGLTTQDSSWKGVIDNAGTAKAGEVNLWLQNGAQWIYENASRKDGLDAANLADYSRPYYEKYDGISHLSSLVGGKDKASAGIIKVNDNDPIHIANAEGVTKVWYDHADTTPGTIIGGDVKVLNAKEGTEMMLYTGNNGITKGFDAADTAAEKNNVSEVLNSLAHKLWYMAGDTNLKGSVSIAEGLTASSATMKTGNITFAEGGQGFYDYTPEEDKTDYKTGGIAESENISKTRKLDINGVAHVDVTEPTTNSGYAKLASALYAGEATYSSNPMIVDMGGKGLALSATTGTGQAAAIYANDNAYINVVNPSAEQKLTITSNNTSTTGAHGIYAKGNAHLNISGPVEITDVTTKGDAANGISIQGEKSEIKIDGSLKISNVKGIRERGKGINASGILVTGDTSSVTVTGPVDISGVRGSGIKLVGANSKVSVGGGNITAAEDSDKSHNFYAVRVEKGTLDINMKDGAAGDTTTKITGDMYATGQYGKKVVEYSGGELIDWKDAGILNVALTNDKSFWKGVAAYDQYNSNYGSGGNTMHDIGQINLYLQNGAAWTNEQQSHVTTTTVSKAEWGGSTLASLHGGSNAANAGLIYQKDNNPISVVNYSGHTTVFYEHDASDPTNIIGGDFNITNAAKGSAITFVTDNTGITSGWNENDAGVDKDNVANVLNNLAGKLFYKSYADGNLAGVVKIADGLTASSAALKTGDISFSTEDSGTKTPGQGYYEYKPSGEKPEYNTGAIKKSEDISKTRELNANGVADVKVTEPTILDGYSKFAAALYADDPTEAMTVKMAGKGLALSSVVEEGAQAAGVFVANGANITVANPSADQKLAITAQNNSTYGAYGIFVKGTGAKLNISGPVEINDVATKGAAVGGVLVRGQNTDVVIDGPLKISNVQAAADNGQGINGSGIGVTGLGSTVTVNGPVDISGIHGSAILLKEVGNKVSVGGGNIAAVADSDKSHNYYAARVERGTLDINMKDGVAGDTTTTISGDMYINCLHGMKPPSLGSEELVEYKEKGVLNVALTDANSSWTGVAAHEKYKTDKHQYGYDMHDVGEFNLYLQNGATWTNEQQSHVTTTTMADKNPIWDGSTLASLHGGSDAAHAGNIFQKDSKNITIENYSGNTNIFYAHEGNGEAAENYKAGDTVIKSAAKDSVVSLITDNTGITMGNKESVANVLNALAGKLTYTNFATGEKNLKGYVKIADGLTASSAALKTGDISFSTETTGTKTPGQGYYEYDAVAENTFTDKITGGNDKKYVEAGIEKEKGIYDFTDNTIINVTKGDYSSELSAIESSGGPITINADGKNLDVSYHVLKGSNVARAVATGLSYGKSKDITVKAKSLKLSTDTTGFYGQGIYATGGKITVDADTTITTSAQTESNGIYSGSGGTVTMNGNLDIRKDSKAANYIALKSDDNGVINVNVKNGKAGNGIVKINGDVLTKSAETYDYWEDETTTSSSTVNLALQGADSSWNGRSLYEVTSSGDDKTSYGNFNLWLTNGANWTNEKNGKEVPNGFAGSHVTAFTGGADAAHAGNIFQKDSKNLTIDKYSGNTNIFYAHEGNGEAAANYKAGDTIIKAAAVGSAVSLITDNTGVAMENANSVANVLNALAGKLTYSNFAKGEENLTGVVKIADGLTASSAALETGDISFDDAGKGFYDYTPLDPSHITNKITGALDETYVKLGIEKEEGIYNFSIDTTIDVTKGKDTNLTAIGSNGGPVTINAEGKALDVSFHATEGNYAARAVASIKYGTGENITIKAGSLKLSADTVGDESQGIFAMSGSTITIDADTTITTSAKKDSNGIFAGRRGTVNMTGNLEIKKDTGAEKYYALKTDSNGIINANVKDGAVGDGIVKINGDIYTKSVASYDRWDDETTITATTINLALKGADSFWNGRSMYNASVAGNDTTSYGNFNLWLADGATWTNEKNGKEVPNGFAGSHVTGFTGGADAAHAGNIFQKDANSLTIDNYSGNTNIFYAHEGNGEAADNYAAGDTIIKHAAEGSVVSMITDNSGIAMDNEYSVANVLNALAGKLTYSNFVDGEKNLTGYVKIADGLTASSKAMQTGDISFSSEDGKGSLKDGSMTPGFTYPETQKPESSKLNNAITGDAKADYNYKKNGILKADGKYIFTQNPSVIEVSEGAAVDVNGKDVEIDTTNALLELKGKDAGINAVDANVNIKGDTNISGETGIIANNSNVTMAGGSKIIGRGGKAISALGGGKVRIDSNLPLYIRGLIYARSGQIYLKGGNGSNIEGDLEASDGGEVDVNLSGDGNVMWGAYRTDENSCVKVYIDEGATWNLTDGEDETKTEGKSLLRMPKDAAAPETGLIVKGGATDKQSGFLNMTNRSKTLDIAHYSGWETIIYNHEGAGDKVTDYKSGNTVISKADKDSGVILSTDNSGITMTDKKAVEATLAALAQKVTYKDHEANAANLTGKVQIAEGLTSSSASQYIGKLHWDANGVGQYDKDSINWKEIYNGDYETLVMKGVRSAATTSMHSWRDNMQDTYTGADLADEDGIFVKALGGKTSSDVKGVKDDNTYRGVQVGLDKALANGWHAGVAFDYRDGDSDYLLGGKGDNQLYSLGVYGVKTFDDQSYLRVAAKAGRVENEYDVYNEIRSLKLHGDYKANAYGLTMEYGKTFGSEASYFTPKAQLTWSQVGSKDYTAHTPNDSMRIDQDSYSSLVARFGVEAGAKSEKGRVYVGLYGAHEFNGDISASYFAKDGGTKHTSFDGSDTWMEMSIGGSYDLSDNCHIYADFAKDFGGDFERKWKASAGLRFEF